MPYLAKFDTTGLEGYLEHYPFEPGETVLCLGEIENMPGHVAVAKNNGMVYFGYHPENFPRYNDEDLCVTIEVPFDLEDEDDGLIGTDADSQDARRGVDGNDTSVRGVGP